MKKKILILIILFSFKGFGQEDLNELAKSVEKEGKLIYKTEMASWYGTDIFLAKYSNKENIGGYFSYVDNDTIKCVFYSREALPGVIGTIHFDSTYNFEKVDLYLIERNFTPNELELYTMRTNALNAILKDSIYTFYKNMSINLIPLIENGVKKVYALTGPPDDSTMILGNDLLIECDSLNKIISKRKLHNNIIPLKYKYENNKENDADISYHNHLKGTSDIITPTDICTLMLYSRFSNWKTHIVISDKYVSLWDCKRNDLMIFTREQFDKLYNK